jgi:hypothetical protein
MSTTAPLFPFAQPLALDWAVLPPLVEILLHHVVRVRKEGQVSAVAGGGSFLSLGALHVPKSLSRTPTADAEQHDAGNVGHGYLPHNLASE